MIVSNLTKRALKIACQAHSGQVDKAGRPYVLHPCHVYMQMTDEVSAAVALLHDVVEDTHWGFDDLRKAGIPEDVVEPLQLLTRTLEEPYEEYISRVAADPVAVTVKLADLAHNSDLTRLPFITPKDVKRAEKYQRAIACLNTTANGPQMEKPFIQYHKISAAI